MNLLEELKAVCREWRRWTEVEAAALRGTDWARVAQCHQAKRVLQETVQRLTRTEGGEAQEALGQIRALVAELVALERSNLASLENRMQTDRQRQTELQRARRNVSRMQNSYAPIHRSHWHSYS